MFNFFNKSFLTLANLVQWIRKCCSSSIWLHWEHNLFSLFIFGLKYLLFSIKRLWCICVLNISILPISTILILFRRCGIFYFSLCYIIYIALYVVNRMYFDISTRGPDVYIIVVMKGQTTDIITKFLCLHSFWFFTLKTYSKRLLSIVNLRWALLTAEANFENSKIQNNCVLGKTLKTDCPMKISLSHHVTKDTFLRTVTFIGWTPTEMMWNWTLLWLMTENILRDC